VRILIVDSLNNSNENQQAIQLILTMPFSKPVDFVFDYANLRLALALDFESHPQLVESLQLLANLKEVQIVGGRVGRNASGELATSEWSGRFGGAWNEANRDCFTEFMSVLGMPIIHRVWDEYQTANEVG
jgi:hypothetical protein